MQTSRRAIVIHSPHSGRSEKLAQALELLQHSGIEITDCISIADLDNLPPQGTNWMQRGIDVAIAAGGDGLVGGVITHIDESGLPLGILPLGTSNDIARSLRIPQEIEMAVQAIAQGKEQEIDVGVARPAEQAPHLASKHQSGPLLAHIATEKHGYFAHALTIGLNVQFARIATNVATRQRYGRMAYPVAALETLRYHEPLDVQLEFEGLLMPQARTSNQGQLEPAPAAMNEPLPLHCRALQVAVVNAPVFGGQWELAIPGAHLADRLLDIVVIEEIELGKFSKTLARFFGPKQTAEANTSSEEDQLFTHHPAELSGIPGIHHLQARGVMITTNADPRDVTLDGEVRGQTPMYVHVAEERLRVMVPN
jgi:diacylglycerol kinase (ATP)